MLEWVELDSSFITAAAFDAEVETIYLRYKDGAEWAYEYCSPEEWEHTNASRPVGREILPPGPQGAPPASNQLAVAVPSVLR